MIRNIIAKIPRNRILPIFIGTVFVILVLGLIYFVVQYNRSSAEISKLKSQTGTVNTDSRDVQQLIQTISKLVKLPENETPTAATITNVELLKNQPFFSQAENGDRLLIYSQTKRAILYRPSIDRIIDIAPISIPPASDQQPVLDQSVSGPLPASASAN